jgi:capsular polysaccharide biosynthesis protein
LNLNEYLRLIVRWGWLIVLLAGLTGGSAYYLSRQQTPVYRATQKVVIKPSRVDLGLAEGSMRVINSMVALMDSQVVASQIIDELQLDITPGELMGNVTFAPDSLRLTIQIDVNNPDPAIAGDVARAWGQHFYDSQEELNQQATSDQRISAVMPDLPTISQFSPRPFLTGVAGALLGAIIGAVIMFVIEYMESAMIRRREDVERGLEINVLSVVPPFEK